MVSHYSLYVYTAIITRLYQIHKHIYLYEVAIYAHQTSQFCIHRNDATNTTYFKINLPQYTQIYFKEFNYS